MVLECGRARIHRWSTTYYFGFHPPPKRGAFVMNGGGERGTCYLSVLHVVISSSCDSSSLKSTPLTTSHLVSFTEGTLASISRFSWNDFSNFMIFCVCLPKSVTRMWRRSFLLCVHFRRLDSCFGNTRKDRVHGQARRESTTHRSTFCMDRYVLFHPSIHLACVYPSSIHLSCYTTRVVRRMIVTFHHRFFFIVPWSTLSFFTKEDSLSKPRDGSITSRAGERDPLPRTLLPIPLDLQGGCRLGIPFAW